MTAANRVEAITCTAAFGNLDRIANMPKQLDARLKRCVRERTEVRQALAQLEMRLGLQGHAGELSEADPMAERISPTPSDAPMTGPSSPAWPFSTEFDRTLKRWTEELQQAAQEVRSALSWYPSPPTLTPGLSQDGGAYRPYFFMPQVRSRGPPSHKKAYRLITSPQMGEMMAIIDAGVKFAEDHARSVNREWSAQDRVNSSMVGNQAG